MRITSILSRVARKLTQGSTPSLAPRPPEVAVHLLTVTHVDVFSGVVGVQFPDPSGYNIPRVRYLQPYTADNPPQVGHAVWAQQYGTDLLVLGQHVVPPNIVTP